MKGINQTNNLFPIFLKGNELRFLIVGGGEVALEKMTALYSNSPKAFVRIVAKEYAESTLEFLKRQSTVEIIHGSFEEKQLEGIQVVITALNDKELSAELKKVANAKGLLYNAADKPELCDFYLGSVVSKGNLKIGISTNGKSPTMAKRIKEILVDSFPEETNEVLENLYEIRTKLKGDISSKIKTLDRLTKQEIQEEAKDVKLKKRVKKASIYSLLIIVTMIVGHLLLSYLPYKDIIHLTQDIKENLDANFWKYILFGFIAQMIDGALGMAYGVSVTTFLTGAGIPGITPAIASASMHASEIFTTGSSSLVYMRFKNINMKLFRSLVWPGILGTVIGVITVSFVSKEYFSVIKPIVAIYTLTLGIIIILRAFKKPKNKKKITRLYPIAFSGGFLDSVGGGGWGPIVTSSLLAGGRHLRYAVGSAHLAKFFVAVVSSITFFFVIGLSHWQVIIGLVIGGMIAAPGSIYLSNKIPIKKGLILVGILIILISLRTLIKAIL
ncbi:MAG: TSUP family transporter [Bacteroidetes bacterium]|nr:TSUP family transporter [Bacteroidota bacterium]